MPCYIIPWNVPGRFPGRFPEGFRKWNLPAWPTGHKGVAVVVLRRSAVRLNAILFSVREHHSDYHRHFKSFLYQNPASLQPYYLIIMLSLYWFVISAAPKVPGSFQGEAGWWLYVLIDEARGAGTSLTRYLYSFVYLLSVRLLNLLSA